MRNVARVPTLLALVLVLGGCAGGPVLSGGSPANTAPTGLVDGDVDASGSADDAGWGYAASLEVAAPADLARPALAPCALRPRTADWLRRENALRGARGWRPADLRAEPRVPLYLDAPSTTCGTPVGVHLGGTGEAGVTVRAYRIGWYGGTGARLVWTSAPMDVVPATGPPRTGDTMTSPGWATAVSLPVTWAWTPGLYLIETYDARGVAGVAGLVVRDGATPAAYTVVDSNLTWTAYSQYGGSSLYKGPDQSADSRALRVALARPLEGAGLERLLVCDVPLANFLERHGFSARYVTDTDVDAWPSLLRATPAVVLPGHSEYWTRRMYDGLLGARNAGVNIADLGANEIYWHARLNLTAAGTPDWMFVARTVAQDPLAATQPDQTTVEWHQPPLRRDPSALMGQRYSAVRASGGMQVLSLPTWLGAGTGLRPGDVLPQVVQNEADGVRATAPATPPDVQTVLVGVLTNPSLRPAPVTATYYTASSGAAVFAAGTTYWTCQLTGTCPGVAIPASTQRAVRALTVNLLTAFASPRWGARHPSRRVLPADPGVLVTTLPSTAVGTYGN